MTEKTTLEELGIEDYYIPELAFNIEDEFDVSIDDGRLEPCKTVGDIINLLIELNH